MITILLVDHSLECKRNVRSLLTQLPAGQFRVIGNTGYRAAFEGLRGHTADVCVIDSSARNSLKLLAQAHSLGFSMPIVMVTGSDASEALAAIRNGAADCLIREQMTLASIECSLCCLVEQWRSAVLQLQRERRYMALLDNVGEIIYTHDLDNNITSMNQAGSDLLGYSIPEILKLKVSTIIDAASQRLVSSTIDLLLDAQTRTGSEVNFTTKAGVPLSVEMNAHPIYQHGKPVEVQVLARLIAQPIAPHANRQRDPIYSSRATPYRLQPEARLAEVRAS